MRKHIALAGELADLSLSEKSLNAVSHGSLREYVLISPAPRMRNFFTFTRLNKVNNCRVCL